MKESELTANEQQLSYLMPFWATEEGLLKEDTFLMKLLMSDIQGYSPIPRSQKNYLHWINGSELEVIFSDLRVNVPSYFPFHDPVSILNTLNRNDALYSLNDSQLQKVLQLGDWDYLGLCLNILKQWEERGKTAHEEAQATAPSNETLERWSQEDMIKRKGYEVKE